MFSNGRLVFGWGYYSLSFHKLTVFYTLDIQCPIVPVLGDGQTYSVNAFEEDEYYEAEGWGYLAEMDVAPMFILVYKHSIYVVVMVVGPFK